jgi:predicted DNA-binding protein with PD1-like motif
MTTGKLQQTAFTALCEVSTRISTEHNIHIQRTNQVHMIALLLAFAATGYSQTASPKAPPPKVFGGARIQEIYRVSLDRDALLLESVQDIVKQKDIREGHVFITAGAVQECTFHYNANTDAVPVNVFKTVKGPWEILTGGGIIAGGDPHLHVTLSLGDQGTVGGHLEKGCRILYLAELTIVKYVAPPLTRRKNANGIMMLEAK